MGSRGPVPTPTKVLSMRGSWLAKTRPEDEVEAKGKPKSPEWLVETAKEMWFRLLPQLEALGIVGEIDEHMLARYCALYARWRECEEFIKENGMTHTVVGKFGSEDKEYPQVERSEKLHQKMMQIERHFGMSPSARAGLVSQKPKKEENDGKERYFRAG